MNVYPGCLLLEDNDGNILALNTQGDVVRIYVPCNKIKKMDMNSIVNNWLENNENYNILEFPEEEEYS